MKCNYCKTTLLQATVYDKDDGREKAKCLFCPHCRLMFSQNLLAEVRVDLRPLKNLN